jgi:Lipocalin-like domain
MKKITLCVLIFTLILSCKTTSLTSTKLDRKSQVEIKGNWIITAVTYPGSEYFSVNSFQIADSKCFVGSTWKFISNNNKGNLSIQKSNCIAFNSPITWFINQEGQFVLKILNTPEKAKKVKEGYVLRIANQSENSFQLTDQIEIGSKPAQIIYQFEKLN